MIVTEGMKVREFMKRHSINSRTEIHSSQLVIVLFYILLVFVLFSVMFVCKYVLCYCHRLSTQLQLTNISYHIYYIMTYIIS
jgi:hypothetical protein